MMILLPFLFSLINAIVQLNLVAADGAATTTTTTTTTGRQSKCERLKTSLTYSQENAPGDMSAVLPLIVERVNRELSGVVDVEVLFSGSDIHRRVGQHAVQCSVTRLLSTTAIASDEEGASSSAEATATDDATDDASGGTDDNALEFQTRGVDEHGRDVVTQCFLVPFTILDVDECNLPKGHSMRHQCADPAICVNTQGSYECICPLSPTDHEEGEDIDINLTFASSNDEQVTTQFWDQIQKSETKFRTPWEKSLSSAKQSSCPSKASTYKCCDFNAHSNDGAQCRSHFTCPIDPCGINMKTNTKRNKTNQDNNDCVSTASCVKANTPLDEPTYTCECPSGFLGSGHTCRRGFDVMPPQPKVKFDGVTPTDETIQNGFYCGCTKPIIEPCAGYDECTGKNQICAVSKDTKEPECVCKPGYVYVDTFGCVDESPPKLKLRQDEDNDGITFLKQGDMYKEYGVDYIDANAEDYNRSLKIAYSRPLPDGCETHIGSFQVNYTVAMPWTNPPYARVTRNVIIEDIDECSIDVKKYETQCPQIIPHCDIDHGAVCQNTKGGYTCKCPKYTTGDGFQSIASIKTDVNGHFLDAPVGYKGGSGCVDTSKPIIEVLGPNPKIFRTPKCGGLSGIMLNAQKEKDNELDKNLVMIQRNGYQDDIKNVIIATAGAELCATSTRTNPRPVDCVRATDHTYLGNVDLSSKVTVGSPIQISPLEWKVPYNVMDEAGNAAVTVWRQIVLEEVDLFEMEGKIRADVLADKDREVKNAVRLALQKERESQSKKNVVAARSNERKPCPICTCENDGKDLTITQCNQQCEEKMRRMNKSNMICENTTESKQNSDMLQYLLDKLTSFTEEAFSSTLIIVSLVVFVVSIQILRMLSNAFTRRGDWHYLNEDDERREEEMLNSVTYFSPEGRRRDSNRHTPLIPSGSSPMPTPSYFSPEARQRQNNDHTNSIPSRPSPMPTATYFSPEARNRQSNGRAPPPTASMFSPIQNGGGIHHGSGPR